LLFSLGSLWRLNEFGLLAQINRITSVSGSSILSAYLALNWKKLNFDKKTHVSPCFEEVIAKPLQKFCSKCLDIPAIIFGILSPWESIGDIVARIYAWCLFGSATMQDIPSPRKSPEFIFYGTSFQTGSSVKISRASISDYKIGKWPKPKLSLAKVVGISSAFPPIMSPVTIECDPEEWEETKGAFLYDKVEYREKLVLTDGGVYDNLGLEAVWKTGFKNVFVCDASAPLKPKKSPCEDWFSQSIRLIDIVTNQTRALRKRTLIHNYQEVDDQGNHLKYGGTYWGISTKIESFKRDDAMVKDNDTTLSLCKISTRLSNFSKKDQGHLINWGYALTDAALRRWYYKTPKEPGNWPIPKYALDKY
jgi:NTE family protein